MLNITVLHGRLTRDPDVRYAQSGTCIANFTLAVDRNIKREGEQQADFFPCVAFGKAAETIGNNLVKGQEITVNGRLQTRNYEDKQGIKRYVTEVVLSNFGGFDFCGKKGDNQGGQGKGNPPPGPDFDGAEIPDEQIPF